MVGEGIVDLFLQPFITLGILQEEPKDTRKRGCDSVIPRDYYEHGVWYDIFELGFVFLNAFLVRLV